MAKSPAFQFYVRDWLAAEEVKMMCAAQRGAYIQLLCYMWLDDSCGLDNNDVKLAKLADMTENEWAKLGQQVKDCFIVDGNRIYHPKLLEQRKDYQKYIENCAKGGLKSWQERSKNPKSMDAVHSARRSAVQSKRSAVQSHFEVPIEVTLNTASASSPAPAPALVLELYKNYPKHEAKAPALKAIEKALSAIAARPENNTPEWLMGRVKCYADAVKGKEKQFIPLPASWFNAERYDDDESCWSAWRETGRRDFDDGKEELRPDLDFNKPTGGV